jgi:hypothetical protein
MVQQCQVIEASGIIRMIFSESGATNLQRLAIERLGRCIVAHCMVQPRQIVEADGIIRMIFSQMPFSQITGPCSQSNSLLVLALLIELNDFRLPPRF